MVKNGTLSVFLISGLFSFKVSFLGNDFARAIDSEPMKARGIIVLVKSNYL